MMHYVGRALCVYATTYALHIANTAPSTVAKEDTLLGEDDILEKYMRFIRHYMMWAHKGFFWVTGTAELLAITTMKWQPTHELSKRVLPLVWPSGNGIENLRFTRISIAGMGLVIGGALLRAYCYRTMKNLFTYDMSIRKGHRLVKEGPYRIVRHPSYLALALVFVGGLMWYSAPGSWARESGMLNTAAGKAFFYGEAFNSFLVVLGTLRRRRVEDENLKRVFGKEWEDWARQVPHSILPWIY